MNRLDKTFESLQAEGRKALITFTMAGDPNIETSLSILKSLARSADVIEIGMPFTDPMADGPAIQAAGLRALAQKVDLKKTLSLVQQFRKDNLNTPVVLMGYFNPILAYGIREFMKNCKDSGVDGLIIVDIPPEEAGEIVPDMQQNNLCLIRLITPTTDEARLQKIIQGASGFLYYVSITGVTGTASADPEKVGEHIAHIKGATKLPVVAGFGIRTPADAAAMAAVADGVVVGSAIVQSIAEKAQSANLIDEIAAQVEALAGSLKHTKAA